MPELLIGEILARLARGEKLDPVEIERLRLEGNRLQGASPTPNANYLVTAAGDLLYGLAANVLGRLRIGTAYQNLGVNAGATAPAWQASLQSLMTAAGDTVQASGANTPARLAIGAAGTVPQVNAGATALAYADIMPKQWTFWHDQAVVTVGNALTLTIDSLQQDNFRAYQETPADGNTFTQAFVLDSGTYTFSVMGLTGTTFGKIDWYLDGVSFSTGQDWYAAALTRNVLKTVSSVAVTASGQHTLKGVINGKNASSSNYYFQSNKYWFR